MNSFYIFELLQFTNLLITTYRKGHKNGGHSENSRQKSSTEDAYEGHHNGEGEEVITTGTMHYSGVGSCRLAHNNSSCTLRKMATKKIYISQYNFNVTRVCCANCLSPRKVKDNPYSKTHTTACQRQYRCDLETVTNHIFEMWLEARLLSTREGGGQCWWGFIFT